MENELIRTRLNFKSDYNVSGVPTNSEKRKSVAISLFESEIETLNKVVKEGNTTKSEWIKEAIKEKMLREGNKQNQKEMGNMAKIYYDDILIGEVVTNQSLTVEEALELIDFNEEEFIREQGFDDVDPNDYRLEY